MKEDMVYGVVDSNGEFVGVDSVGEWSTNKATQRPCEPMMFADNASAEALCRFLTGHFGEEFKPQEFEE